MKLEILHQKSPDKAIISQIEKSLEEHNFSLGGTRDRVDVLFTGYDSEKKLQAGLVGLMGWNWLFISMLWVSEAYRRQGYGSMLLSEAEKLAKQNKCFGCYLDTMSFQAPDFYKRKGYKEFGRLDNFLDGQSRFWLSKSLGEEQK